MKLLKVGFLVLIISAGASASEYQIVYQQRIDSAQNYHYIDPVISSDSLLLGLIYCANVLTIDLFASGQQQTILLGPSRTINTFNADQDTLYLYMLGSYCLIRYSLTSDLVVADSVSRGTIPFQGCGWSCGIEHKELDFCRCQNDGPLVRVLLLQCTYWYDMMGQCDGIIGTTFIISPGLEQQLLRKHATWLSLANLTGSQDTVSLDNRDYYDADRVWYEDDSGLHWWELDVIADETWGSLSIVPGNGADSIRIQTDNMWYRSLHTGRFLGSAQTEQIIVQYWGGVWSPWELWAHPLTSACLSYEGGQIDTVWVTDVDELILQHVFEPARAIVGTSGRINNRKWDDSLVVFMDYSYGVPYDTVFLDRSLQALKFFETSGPTLNLVGRTYDTIFVYQFQVSTDVDEPSVQPIQPNSIVLRQNYPNPFNGQTVIEIDNPRRQHIRLAVYNVLGQQVTEIHKGTLPKGPASFTWDGCNEYSKPLPTGVYFARLETRYGTETVKMLLLR